MTDLSDSVHRFAESTNIERGIAPRPFKTKCHRRICPAPKLLTFTGVTSEISAHD